MAIEDITAEVGTYIRDTLRNNSELITLLGITKPENHIFFTRPNDQHKGFKNPRIVVEPLPSNSQPYANTDFIVGDENFQVTTWISSKTFTDVFKVNSIILNLFNGATYIFKDSQDKFINFGIFESLDKDSIPDPDKENTRQGNISLRLRIGGSEESNLI